LYRGSTMLLHDQIVEAKEELERALALQPQDAKSQDLLAGVYFRLGVYPRAIEIWRRLAGEPRARALQDGSGAGVAHAPARGTPHAARA
ncbi:MAG: hypothetical protein MUE69_26920, partial [Myxococcota bacterium]|nr:hypothetical protein [Myxococcota bacterium]